MPDRARWLPEHPPIGMKNLRWKEPKIAVALFGFTSGKSWIYRGIRRPRWKGQKPALNPLRPTENHRRGLPRQLLGGL